MTPIQDALHNAPKDSLVVILPEIVSRAISLIEAQNPLPQEENAEQPLSETAVSPETVISPETAMALETAMAQEQNEAAQLQLKSNKHGKAKTHKKRKASKSPAKATVLAAESLNGMGNTQA